MLSQAGAKVILACRSTEKADAAVAKLIAENASAKLEVRKLDLGNLDSVRAFASVWGNEPIDMLVLNGGVMAAPHAEPETHMMVNHVGHALFTILLFPNIASVCGRIVFVSSLTYIISDLHLDDISFANRKYNWMTAYANSKLAMILFMKALAFRLPGANVQLNAVHPGEATSDVARNLGNMWMSTHKNVGKFFLLDVEESARTSVWVAGAKEMQTSAQLYHRVTETLQIPDRFLLDVDGMWDVTMKMGGITDDDLKRLDQSVAGTKL